jgi:hypothetical protein
MPKRPQGRANIPPNVDLHHWGSLEIRSDGQQIFWLRPGLELTEKAMQALKPSSAGVFRSSEHEALCRITVDQRAAWIASRLAHQARGDFLSPMPDWTITALEGATVVTDDHKNHGAPLRETDKTLPESVGLLVWLAGPCCLAARVELVNKGAAIFLEAERAWFNSLPRLDKAAEVYRRISGCRLLAARVRGGRIAPDVREPHQVRYAERLAKIRERDQLPPAA